jgi:Cell shape-determining protein
MFATSQPRERVSWLEAAVRDGLTPLFLAFNRIAETAAGVWDTAVSLKSALEENRRLQEEVEALRREVARLEEFERENAVLRRAMNLPEAARSP